MANAGNARPPDRLKGPVLCFLARRLVGKGERKRGRTSDEKTRDQAREFCPCSTEPRIHHRSPWNLNSASITESVTPAKRLTRSRGSRTRESAYPGGRPKFTSWLGGRIMSNSLRRDSNVYDRSKLRTVHLVPLTAFDASGKLALDVQARHTAKMYSAGMRVFLPAAGTSEYHSLSADEIVALVKVTREASGPDAQIFAPLGLQVQHAIDVGLRSLEAGATGVMFMPFAHPYLCNAGARDYYRQVIDRLRCPTLIYKKSPIPSDQLLLELAGDPHVVGVKYAENNLHDFRRTVLEDRGRIEWLCGSAERFAPYYMLAGATGFTTGAGNVCPHLALAMHAALAAGEYGEAMCWQKQILPIEDFRAREGDSYNVSMLKHALRRLGSDFGAPRPPLRQLTAAERGAIDDLLAPILAAERDLQQEELTVGLADGGA